ncbi:hypothetical protein HYH03_009745 [Edaphochlamys debaryana]|uniref:F-box domain-containing protein n=1 Tax=Edaphochlamys debaryana TaxID=47281 RepID=A0A835XXI2_9CHLO|nr:hypothetical protein HYH03_009745 [Edaphochlamys debaryana]|eukprot:KAG2492016.1 hypothetical protein HYH03_009745 [Edaphochlamys debaryana]
MGGPIIVHPLFVHTLHCGPEVRTLEEVPLEVLTLIASRIPMAQELARLQCVSKRCREAASAEHLWKQLCMDRFAVPGSCKPPSWQALFRFNYEFLYKVLLSRSAEELSGFSRFSGGSGSRFVGMAIGVA